MGEFSWKDSNVALFGSDSDRSVKKESAETEPAWKGVRDVKQSTVMIWRINKFKLEEVRQQDHGKFFRGDSYVVLNVDKVGDEFLYDVHFWIGENSTQDEYGTAAYKTVELDTLLDDKAIQHREVDGFESDKFKKYFATFEKLKGGYETGFRHVKPDEAKPRLFIFHGLDINHVELREVAYTRMSLNSDDVFILEDGKKAYQWNGKGATKDERFRGGQYLHAIEGGVKTQVVDETDKDESDKFIAMLPDSPADKKVTQEAGKKAIYKLSDESGKMKLSLVCEERLSKGALTNDDAFLIDSGTALYVYIGDKCSRNEKLNALSHAHEYLKSTGHPFVPITVVSGNRKSAELEKVLE